MQPYPHVYTVAASGAATGTVPIAAAGLPTLNANSPREFDGPGDQWSPESMLCAAVASCFILTFRTVARASRIEWSQLTCDVAGTLERIEGESRFTKFVTQATLTVPKGMDEARCRQALEKAERGCLVANSLHAARVLEATVTEL
jgi:organic hydroperoxide reductase OsmC/OhrA